MLPVHIELTQKLVQLMGFVRKTETTTRQHQSRTRNELAWTDGCFHNSNWQTCAWGNFLNPYYINEFYYRRCPFATSYRIASKQSRYWRNKKIECVCCSSSSLCLIAANIRWVHLLSPPSVQLHIRNMIPNNNQKEVTSKKWVKLIWVYWNVLFHSYTKKKKKKCPSVMTPAFQKLERRCGYLHKAGLLS